ncbi:hypothetical protein GE21DRAFT_6735 [Neurospora crassa]|uniref:Potassium channel protein n=1 Tax=Neurospora crassa (strain ATCC 24698 / 74-OR23-1A / CBS 708.71 / DSM 1257 / FGSC 987) TaxID=367110 RepID=Q7S9D1_NEUCR|nr:potassium channel protein [Neurospora crassa OR74A]EAA32964.2 potassium channel protein [Neurospora crassa OR74A]KHE85414.1 hypothetical protein GE21DRAFT_6735 [Neurospora crassa]|eukprot:XP_962200.2 potassium channel protein [Neurospora crassa OR74A]
MGQQSSPSSARRRGRLNSDRPTSIFTFSDPVRSRPRPNPTSSSREPPPNNEVRTLFNGHINLRGRNDNLPQKWWPASTAIPLLVATIGPLSHVLSIASLVTTWKVTLPDSGILPDGKDDNGIGIPDPKWEINANIVSLICGFAGNFFLLLNFTGRVRYVVAIPAAVGAWVFSSGILVAILLAMHIHSPPVWPEIYSQGYYHAIFSAFFYALGAVLLAINMLGYLRGYYPQQFDLDDDQRTLILQTMLFFVWLAGGGAVFAWLEDWPGGFCDGLYYCDVTILTIGFGDFAPATTAGRAFLMPFQTLGLLFLGLVISSVSRFAANISADKIIKRHQEHSRRSTVGMSVTNENELREKLGLPPKRKVSNARGGNGGRRAFSARRSSLAQYGRLEVAGRMVTFRRHSRAEVGGASEGHSVERAADAKGGENENRTKEEEARQKMLKFDFGNDNGKGAEEITRNGSGEKSLSQDKRKQRRQKLLLLKDDRDRFETMRQIQDETKRWKQYWALAMAFLAFSILWGFGAVVFMLTEARISNLSYFDSLYFCWVWLVTIGYGDIAPKSNIGKPFFIVWSLIAVPIITVLFQEMSSTVVRAVNRGAFKVADWTIMPTSKRGVLDKYIQNHPWLQKFVGKRQDAEESAREAGAGTEQPGNLEGPAEGADEQEEDLPSLLSKTIKSIAHDLRFSPQKRYSYEEWQLFTKLIQFTQREEEVDDEGITMTGDWLSEDSPLLADITEAEWVLDRLCESLDRYTRSSSHQKPRPQPKHGEATDAELDPLRIETEQRLLNNIEEESERGRRNRDVSPS